MYQKNTQTLKRHFKNQTKTLKLVSSEWKLWYIMSHRERVEKMDRKNQWIDPRLSSHSAFLFGCRAKFDSYHKVYKDIENISNGILKSKI